MTRNKFITKNVIEKNFKLAHTVSLQPDFPKAYEYIDFNTILDY